MDKHIFSTCRLEVVFRCQTTGKLVGSERKLKLLIESHFVWLKLRFCILQLVLILNIVVSFNILCFTEKQK